MENADVQLIKQLLESLIERINLNPDKTLKNIEFKFEVPNQHTIENQDKNAILTYDTVHRIPLTANFIANKDTQTGVL